MDTLNDAMCKALREYMADHRIGRRAVATQLDRSIDYVQGRISGRSALSVDIVSAVAQLTNVSDRDLIVEIMSRMAGAGQGSSDS